MIYVYELRDQNGKVFYVGKGRQSRIRSHRNPSMLKRDRPVNHKIKDIRAEGFDFTSHRIFETTDEEEAFCFEQKRISEIGLHNLVNISTGGRGPFGVPKSDLARLKSSLRFKGVPKSEGHRKRIADALKGKKKTPEHCAKMSKSTKGRKISEEHKSLLRNIFTGRPISEEQKAKISAALTGRKRGPLSEDQRKKVSEGLRKFHQERRESLGLPPVSRWRKYSKFSSP